MAKLSARGRKEYWRATKAQQIEHDGHEAVQTVTKAYLDDGVVLVKSKIENGSGPEPFGGWKQLGKWAMGSVRARDLINRLKAEGWEIQENTKL